MLNMWLLLQIKKLHNHQQLSLLFFVVACVHALVLGTCLYYAQKNSLQRFVLNAPKVYGTVVLMPMQKKVARKKTIQGQSEQARKVISYNQYKEQQKKKSSGKKQPVKTAKKSSAKNAVKKQVAVQQYQQLAATSLVSSVRAQKKAAPVKKEKVVVKNKKQPKKQELKKHVHSVAFTMPLAVEEVQAPPTPPTKQQEVTLQEPVAVVEQEEVASEKTVVHAEAAPSPSTLPEQADDGIDMTGGILGQEEFGDVVQMGRDELVALELQEGITQAIQLVWFPPLGLSRSCAGSVQITTDTHGHVTDVLTVKKSTSVAYDIAARNAIANAVFEDIRLHKKTFIVELGNDE